MIVKRDRGEVIAEGVVSVDVVPSEKYGSNTGSTIFRQIGQHRKFAFGFLTNVPMHELQSAYP